MITVSLSRSCSNQQPLASTSTAPLSDSGSSEDDTGNEVIPSDESDLELKVQREDEPDFVSTHDTTLDLTVMSPSQYTFPKSEIVMLPIG